LSEISRNGIIYKNMGCPMKAARIGMAPGTSSEHHTLGGSHTSMEIVPKLFTLITVPYFLQNASPPKERYWYLSLFCATSSTKLS